jgi:hypothetical protein
MSNPATVNTAKNAWVKVLSNRTNGQVFGNDSDANYLITYRDAGDPAPANTAADKSRALRLGGDGYTVSDPTGVDVYVFADDDNGSVLVF